MNFYVSKDQVSDFMTEFLVLEERAELDNLQTQLREHRGRNADAVSGGHIGRVVRAPAGVL